jgi:hypothetical protein
MFRLPSRRERGPADPLRSRRAAAEWFRDLPALDVIGRQTHVVAELVRLKGAHAAIDLDRVAAVLYLDAAMGVDRRRLTKWYFENLRGSAQMAERFWNAALEAGNGFVDAYRAALDAALAQSGDARWRICLPRLFARLVYYHGAVAMLRLLRGERLPRDAWRELHALFLQACEHRCERSSTSLPGEDPSPTHGTVEHEYLHVLLQDRLDTGNLAPAEIQWITGKLHSWSRRLTLESKPRSRDGFYVDLAGDAGLARLAGTAEGAQVGYLDTAPVVAEIERAMRALGAPDPDGRTWPDWVKLQQIGVLERIRPAFLGSRPSELRRHPRLPTDLPVDVRVGLAEIAQVLAASKPASAAPEAPAARRPAKARPPSARPARAVTTDDVEEIEIPALPGDAWPRDPAPDAPPVQRRRAERTAWRLLDRSAAGWRISAPRDDAGARLALGALIAVSAAADEDWMLGVVSRLATEARDEIVAGMSLIASRAVPVTLYAQRRAQETMSVVVDGVDLAAFGARFDGLYLMPPARPDARPAARSLIVPAPEYFEGRRVILSTPRAHYAVTLRKIIDQRADWSWVTIQVSGKAT